MKCASLVACSCFAVANATRDSDIVISTYFDSGCTGLQSEFRAVEGQCYPQMKSLGAGSWGSQIVGCDRNRMDDEVVTAMYYGDEECKITLPVHGPYGDTWIRGTCFENERGTWTKVECSTVSIWELVTWDSHYKQDLTTLASFLLAADLEDTLLCNQASQCPSTGYTLFAPSNEAFGKLPAAYLDNLLQPSNKFILQDIMNHHLLSTQVPSSMQEFVTDFEPVGGKTLTVINKGKGQMTVVDEDVVVKVTIADGLATNGIMHVVDTVLGIPAGELTGTIV